MLAYGKGPHRLMVCIHIWQHRTRLEKKNKKIRLKCLFTISGKERFLYLELKLKLIKTIYYIPTNFHLKKSPVASKVLL